MMAAAAAPQSHGLALGFSIRGRASLRLRSNEALHSENERRDR